MAASAIQDAWVARVLGVAPAGAAAGAPGGMAGWTARRSEVMASLRQIAGEIAAAKHPSSAKAIIEIQAVIKNLTAEPATPQQVAELQRYLETDQVVADVSELADDIRTPLLGALRALESEAVA
jgi:hypothetical protein